MFTAFLIVALSAAVLLSFALAFVAAESEPINEPLKPCEAEAG